MDEPTLVGTGTWWEKVSVSKSRVKSNYFCKNEITEQTTVLPVANQPAGETRLLRLKRFNSNPKFWFGCLLLTTLLTGPHRNDRCCYSRENRDETWLKSFLLCVATGGDVVIFKGSAVNRSSPVRPRSNRDDAKRAVKNNSHKRSLN